MAMVMVSERGANHEFGRDVLGCSKDPPQAWISWYVFHVGIRRLRICTWCCTLAILTLYFSQRLITQMKLKLNIGKHEQSWELEIRNNPPPSKPH